MGAGARVDGQLAEADETLLGLHARHPRQVRFDPLLELLLDLLRLQRLRGLARHEADPAFTRPMMGFTWDPACAFATDADQMTGRMQAGIQKAPCFIDAGLVFPCLYGGFDDMHQRVVPMENP